MSYNPTVYNALNYLTLSTTQEQINYVYDINFNDHNDSGVDYSQNTLTKKDMLGDCLAVSAIARTAYSTGNTNTNNQEYAASKNYYLNSSNESPEKLGRIHSTGYSQANDYSEYSFDKISELDMSQDNTNSTNMDIVDYSYILFFRTFK